MFEIDPRYSLRSELNVWCSANSPETLGDAASDDVLARIAQIIQQARDVSCDSEEINSGITDWPSRYYLSSQRLNALRPMAHVCKGRVLEIGADCGTLTRYLGERGVQVTALEQCLPKAAIAAMRCHGLEDVRVVCDRLNTFGAPQPFDSIILIGALERSGSWIDGVDPARAMLTRCAELLNPRGRLVLAVDNRLGLKYFAGAPEEHTGRVFHGISGIYGGSGSRTFGRQELQEELRLAGFRWYEFLYPLPDYILAQLILHPSAFHDRDLPVNDLIFSCTASHDRQSAYPRLFSERLVWQSLARNGLAEDLANSFVVVASREKPAYPLLSERVLAYSYAVVRRRWYQKSNQVVRSGSKLVVRRARLYDLPAPDDGPCRQALRNERFRSGSVYANKLYELLEKPSWTFRAIMDWFQPYYEFLRAHCDTSGRLPPNFLDCTPFNVMLRPSGRLEPFDLEWIAREPPPLNLVLFRGLVYTLNSTVTVAPPGEDLGLGVLDLALRILREAGETLDDDAVEDLFRQEEMQQKWVVGDHVSLPREYWRAARLVVRPESLLNASRLRDQNIGRPVQESMEQNRQQFTVRTDAADAHPKTGTQLERNGTVLRQAATEQEVAVGRIETEASAPRTALALQGGEAGSVRQPVTLLNSIIQWLQATLAERDNQIAILTGDAAALRAEIGNLKDSVEQRERSLADLGSEIAAKERRAAELAARVTELSRALVQGEERLAALAQEMSGRTAEIEALGGAVTVMRNQLSERERTAACLEDELRTVRAVIARQRDRADSLAAELTGRDSSIRLLLSHIGALRTAVLNAEQRIARLRLSGVERERAVRRAEAELAAAQASFAWRAAAPLRLLEDGVRYLRDRFVGALVVLRYALSALPGSRTGHRRCAAVVAASGCFDPVFYLRRYQNVERMRINPVMHYVVRGAREGANPNILFDATYYLNQVRTGINPLVDYLERAAQNGVNPHPLFNTSYYLAKNPDVAAAAFNPLVHYLGPGATEARDPHPLFDTAFYLAGAPDVAAAEINPLQHYLEFGAAEGRDPHPLFSTSYYLENNPDVAEEEINPLRHYVEHGATEGRNPHPLFDSRFYREANRLSTEAVSNPLVHYCEFGAAECRDPHPLFDARFYLEQAGGAAAGNPLAHYLRHGAVAGFDPHPLFSTSHYLEQAPEAIAAANPLVHYVHRGAAAGHDPHPLFDTSCYLGRNLDILLSGCNPLAHYIQYGEAEGRYPHPLFDTSFYRERNAGVVEYDRNQLSHYLTCGHQEGCDPHPLFNTSFYLQQNPDVAEKGCNPLLHYLKFGGKEGRDPHPLFTSSYYWHNSAGRVGPGTNPLVHYLAHGARARLNPHPLFDTEFYLENCEDPDAVENPLAHYLRRGAAQGTDPHPLFDTSYYREHHLAGAGVDENPLVHFIVKGTSEGHDPHPLFDMDFYLASNPELAGTGINPLVHYLQVDAAARKDPHCLFDTSFYLERNPEVAQTGVIPLIHYLRQGFRDGRDPHPLFDTSYYLEQYSDIREADINPLTHFLTRGGLEGRDPHPLFHSAFYMQQCPEIAGEGVNPLVHYLRDGARAGKNPNPMFDSAFYLERNQDVAESGINPLAHYLLWGAAEGRAPSPAFDTSLYLRQHPEAVKDGINPLVHYFEKSGHTPPAVIAVPTAPAPAPRPVRRGAGGAIAVRNLGTVGKRAWAPAAGWRGTVLCVTHVPVYPPRAGNEYRVYRMLRYLQQSGYRVVLVLSPLQGEELSDEQLRAIADHFPDVVLSRPGGELVCHLKDDCADAIAVLHGTRVPSYSQVLGEDAINDADALEQVRLDRTFCHDCLIATVMRLRAALGRCVVLAEYIFMSRLLPLVDGDTLKVIDTHDVFSSRKEKVAEFGASDALNITPEQERARLLRADLVLAIQMAEERVLTELVPERRVVRVPVDFDVQQADAPPEYHKILYIASDNPMNVKGLHEFVRLAWPFILRDVPDAELLIAGRVSTALPYAAPGVRPLGVVEDLEPLYREARVVINPAVAGTGLKIKTVEAVCRFRPVVTWPSGIDGMEPELAARCLTVRDWYDFYRRVVEILLAPAQEWFSEAQKAAVQRFVRPAAVYAALRRELDAFFDRPTHAETGGETSEATHA